MAVLTESSASYPAGIYQIETTDPVLGGAPNEETGAGMSNVPHQQLARRTAWLKATLDALSGIAMTTTNSPRLLAQNGYFRLGTSGLIIQWGRSAIVEAPTAVVFPTPFPTACFAVSALDSSSSSQPDRAHVLSILDGSITKNGFTAWGRNVGGTAYVQTGMHFIAVGH